jgi:hypothetical protein
VKPVRKKKGEKGTSHENVKDMTVIERKKKKGAMRKKDLGIVSRSYSSQNRRNRNKSGGFTTNHHLFLLRELLSTNVGTTELNVQHALHGTEDLLVGGGGATLEVLDDGDGGVALGGEFLLGHLVALLVAALLDGIADDGADGLGLDDVVAAVDLGEVLAFGCACLGTLLILVSISYGLGGFIEGVLPRTMLPVVYFFSVVTAPER